MSPPRRTVKGHIRPQAPTPSRSLDRVREKLQLYAMWDRKEHLARKRMGRECHSWVPLSLLALSLQWAAGPTELGLLLSVEEGRHRGAGPTLTTYLR